MKPDIRKKLAENIKKIRQSKNMTQGDVCRLTGMDRAYISSLEAGKRNPTIVNIEKIALALGVEVSEILHC
jgi:transcriptional regulator with XRE-family HTH domain